MRRLLTLGSLLVALSGCPAQPAPCVPAACVEGTSCGQLDDGCGGTLDCGDCPAGLSCGAGGTANLCGACLPSHDCLAAGIQCGPMPDNCGGTFQCPSCGAGKKCVSGKCVCAPTTCIQLGLNCGQADDGCGGTLKCGNCQGVQTCGGGGIPNVCGCTRKTCEGLAKNCGTVGDGCGGTLKCGTCTQPLTCGGAGTANLCGQPAADKVCSGGWCWESPAPQGHSLGGVWAESATDLWAVGEDGTAIRFDGSRWSAWPTGTTSELRAVWGSGANDVWAVGAAGTILHFDGRTWSPSVSGTSAELYAVTGTGPSDIWAFGASGTALHFTGTWAPTVSGAKGTLYAAHARAPGEVHAVGDAGTALLWNGTGWAPKGVFGATPSTRLTAVFALGSSDAWAGDSAGNFYRYSGSWSKVSSPVAQFGITALWGASSGDVHAATGDGWSGNSQTFHWNGSKWSAAFYDGDGLGMLRALSGASASEVWAVGGQGYLLQWNGSAWSKKSAAVTATPFWDVFAVSPTEAWMAGTSNMWRYTGGGIVAVSHGAGNFSTWADGRVWASGPNDVWVTGELRSGLSSWGAVEHFDGNSLTMTDFILSPTTLLAHDVWGSGPNDVWVVCDAGVINHWNGFGWSNTSSGAAGNFYGVWGSGPSDVWAVGAAGQVSRWNGSRWSASNIGDSTNLTSVGGSGPNDVWAVGGSGKIFHWSGSTWSPSPSGTTDNLGRVSAASPTDAWVTGPATPLHWDGRVWTPTPVAGGIVRIHALPGGTAFAAGSHATLLRKP